MTDGGRFGRAAAAVAAVVAVLVAVLLATAGARKGSRFVPHACQSRWSSQECALLFAGRVD